MPQIINAGVLDAALTGSEVFPFQEAAGGAGSVKHTTLDTIAAYVRNQIIVAASDSPAQWKAWAGATNTCTGTNDGATINAAVQAVAPVAARKLATIMYAPGTYNISTDAILMQTGVAHTSFGGAWATYIKAVNASCRGLVMLRDGNEHFWAFDGFTMHGNLASGARLGTNVYPNVGNIAWIDYRAGNDAAFVTDSQLATVDGAAISPLPPTPPTSGFQSSNWSGKAGVLASAGGCATDWNGSNNTTMASLYDTGSTGFAQISRIRGGRFSSGQFNVSSVMTNFNRSGISLHNSATSHLPASNGMTIDNIDLTSTASGPCIWIQGCADGSIGQIHLGSGSWGLYMDCSEWRITDFKCYFQTAGGINTLSGQHQFAGGNVEDCNGTGIVAGGAGSTYVGVHSNSNLIGWEINASRINVKGGAAYNRSSTSGFASSGVSQTIGVQIANNRTGLDIDINCTDGQAVTSTTPQNPLVFVGSIPTGRIRIVNGAQVISYGDEFSQSTKPTGSYESYPRVNGVADRAALSTGRVSLQSIRLPAGLPVTNITFASITTAAGTPTHWWFSLCDNTYTTLRSTADQTSTAWAANTVMPKALSSPFVTLYEGLYYVAVMMTATTVVSLAGQAVNSTVGGIAPLICPTGVSGQTTAPADGTLLASPAVASSFALWCDVT